MHNSQFPNEPNQFHFHLESTDFQEKEEQKPIRACDGCRSRKRKCDGAKPYCSNCIKNSARDERGNPVCTYSQVQKKRGPKKGYKDTLLQRLESLEAILNPLQKGGKFDETSQWAERHQGIDWHPETDTERETAIPQSLSYQSPTLFSEQADFPDEEFELHLLRLGLQYCTSATNYRLSLLLGEDYQFHQKTIHPSLRVALCAHGLYYSKHPCLDNLAGKDQKFNINNAVARYLKQAETSLPKPPQMEYELIDSIRAMLVIVAGYLAIGRPDDAVRVNGVMY